MSNHTLRFACLSQTPAVAAMIYVKLHNAVD